MPAEPGEPLVGLKWDLSRFSSYRPFLEGLGGGLSFTEVVWCDIEAQQGTRDWSRVDQAVEQMTKVGFRPALKLRVGSCWSTGGQVGPARGRRSKTASALPTDLDAYRDFVRSAVARYAPRGVREYAVENEVNAVVFWQGSTAEYQELVKLAALTVHAADRTARVLDGGISSTGYGVAIAQRLLDAGHEADAVAAYQRWYARRATRQRDFPSISDGAGLRRALGGEVARRDLEFLTATADLARTGVIDAVQVHFYERWDNVPALLDHLRLTLPASTPVEAWEVGQYWTDGPTDAAVHANEAAKTLALLLGGGVRPVVWLPAAHDPGGRRSSETRWGLFDEGGTVRPAALVFTAVAKAGGRSARAVAAGGIAGVAVGGADHSLLVVWSDRGANLGPRPVADPTVVAATGSPRTWTTGGLEVGPDPLFVRVPAGLDDATRLVR